MSFVISCCRSHSYRFEAAVAIRRKAGVAEIGAAYFASASARPIFCHHLVLLVRVRLLMTGVPALGVDGGGGVDRYLQLKQEADAKKKKLAQDAKDRVAADKRAKLEVFTCERWCAFSATQRHVLADVRTFRSTTGTGSCVYAFCNLVDNLYVREPRPCLSTSKHHF